MRYPRCKDEKRTTWHLAGNKAGGPVGAKALADPRARRMLKRLIKRDAKRFRGSVASFSVTPNEFRLAVRFPRFRKLSRRRLRRIAKRFYKDSKRPPWRHWNEQQWDDFNHRLFDISAFMGSLEGDFGRWYNRLFGRQGHFWAGRFWSTLCEDLSGARECVLLAELAPVHMGLAGRPEQWKEGSARLRRLRRGRWLLPLGEIFSGGSGDPYARYRGRLLQRALNAEAPVDEAGFERALRERGEEKPAGGYSAMLGRYLERGVVAGLADQVQPWLDWLKSLKRYNCRDRPAPVPRAAPLTVLRRPVASPPIA